MITIHMVVKIQAETTFEIGGNYQVKQLSPEFRRDQRNGSNRRSKTLKRSKKAGI